MYKTQLVIDGGTILLESHHLNPGVKLIITDAILITGEAEYIISNDKIDVHNLLNINSQKIKKPPIGLMPKKLHLENRKTDIEKAVARYTESGLDVPSQWFAELWDIVQQLKDD